MWIVLPLTLQCPGLCRFLLGVLEMSCKEQNTSQQRTRRRIFARIPVQLLRIFAGLSRQSAECVNVLCVLSKWAQTPTELPVSPIPLSLSLSLFLSMSMLPEVLKNCQTFHAPAKSLNVGPAFFVSINRKAYENRYSNYSFSVPKWKFSRFFHCCKNVLSQSVALCPVREGGLISWANVAVFHVFCGVFWVAGSNLDERSGIFIVIWRICYLCTVRRTTLFFDRIINKKYGICVFCLIALYLSIWMFYCIHCEIEL